MSHYRIRAFVLHFPHCIKNFSESFVYSHTPPENFANFRPFRSPRKDYPETSHRARISARKGKTRQGIKQSSRISDDDKITTIGRGERGGQSHEKRWGEMEKKYVTCWHGWSRRVGIRLRSQMRLWHMHEPRPPEPPFSRSPSIFSLLHHASAFRSPCTLVPLWPLAFARNSRGEVEELILVSLLYHLRLTACLVHGMW